MYNLNTLIFVEFPTKIIIAMDRGFDGEYKYVGAAESEASTELPDPGVHTCGRDAPVYTRCTNGKEFILVYGDDELLISRY